MPARNATKKQIEENKKNQEIRIKAKRAARRSGKITKSEGKVESSKVKTRKPISQKRTATVKKSRH